jgi:glycosyltransferase involved in cell wall biosynthesis
MSESNVPLRVLVTLCGDMNHDPESIVKYGELIEALKRKFPIVDVYNAKLHGIQRIANTVFDWHPNLKTWSERVNKNPRTFILRSQKTARWITSNNKWDLILQLGALFDSNWYRDPHLPHIIYTDYTAKMSSRQPSAGRAPHRGSKQNNWIALERDTYRHATHICVRSRMVGKSISEDYALPAEQISVIGGGVNLDALPKFSLGHVDRPPTALFIGPDFYRKGGDLALRAFAQTRTVIPDAQLIFVTEGEIPSYLPREGVKVMSPNWDRTEFLKLYTSADIFVSPSRLETWGDTILEAMAFGLPCIGVSGQPMEEIIRNEETGLLIPPEDVPCLANALIRLFQQAALRQQMGQIARRIVSEDFTWDVIVSRLLSILKSSAQISISKLS